jgi:hypothetical protein
MARVDQDARVLAVLINASKATWTICIPSALWLSFNLWQGAVNPRISLIPWWTPTLRPVVTNRALSIWCARVLVKARVYALGVYAGFVKRTFKVRVATSWPAHDLRIALEPWWTPTQSFVVRWIALGRCCAWVLNVARIDALSVDAGLVKCTVIVAAASS